jgi:16S rRNA (cytosine967-C5)-methyltransferase
MSDPRDLAVDALMEVERGERRAREAVEARRQALADPRDRALLTEVVYGAVRRRGTIDALLSAASKTPLARLSPVVRAAMRAATAQALFLDRVPAFAAVNAAVEVVKARTNPRYAGFANAVLRGVLRTVEGEAVGPEDPRRDVPRPGRPALRLVRPLFADPAVDAAANLAERWAHPTWLVRRWLARHGEATARAIVEAGASRAPISLRAAPGAREAVLAALAAAGVSAHAGEGPDEVVAEGGEAAALFPVKEGLASVQDGTAQRVAPLLALRPGDRVLDLCAAPGGKTTHVLDLLAGRGDVTACDVAPDKVAALARLLASRAAAGDAAAAASRAVLVPREGELPFAPGTFHAVLVDAPCSNTGVMRRRLEVRDRLRESDVARAAAAQRALLERALPLVRPGGRLVYATCSIEPEEDEDVVAAFSAAHPEAQVVPGFSVLPGGDRDGGFAAGFTLSSLPPP